MRQAPVGGINVHRQGKHATARCQPTPEGVAHSKAKAQEAGDQADELQAEIDELTDQCDAVIDSVDAI